MVATRFDIRGGLNSRVLPLHARRRRPVSWYRTYRRLAWDDLKADVYLAFIGSGPLQLSGFLVTAKDDINAIIAHCPVTIDARDSKGSYRNIHEQLHLARKIAENPDQVEEMDDVVALIRLVRQGRPIPRWVYALACIPLSYQGDGDFLYPTPFCPRLSAGLSVDR